MHGKSAIRLLVGRVPQRVAIAAITGYQRYLSTYKGFSCAYRVHAGGESCSAYGKRVIARHGLVPGLALLRRRMAACGEVHRRFLAPLRHPAPQRRRLTLSNRQAGFCDASCDSPGCDVPGCDMGDVCDAGECALDIGELYRDLKRRLRNDIDACCCGPARALNERRARQRPPR